MMVRGFQNNIIFWPSTSMEVNQLVECGQPILLRSWRSPWWGRPRRCFWPAYRCRWRWHRSRFRLRPRRWRWRDVDRRRSAGTAFKHTELMSFDKNVNFNCFFNLVVLKLNWRYCFLLDPKKHFLKLCLNLMALSCLMMLLLRHDHLPAIPCAAFGVPQHRCPQFASAVGQRRASEIMTGTSL